jgi:hypothetical protein
MCVLRARSTLVLVASCRCVGVRCSLRHLVAQLVVSVRFELWDSALGSGLRVLLRLLLLLLQLSLLHLLLLPLLLRLSLLLLRCYPFAFSCPPPSVCRPLSVACRACADPVHPP